MSRASSIAILVCVASLLTSALPAQAQEDGEILDRITLRDGSILQGWIVDEDEHSITLETRYLGRVTLEKGDVQRVFRAEQPFDSTGWAVDPDYNTILLVPTPETLPRGEAYFRDFELFFLNFGMGVTDNFNLSFATLFPISSELFMFGGGAKLRLLSREKYPIGLALLANVTHFDEVSFGTAGGVVGIGDKRKSFNFSAQKSFSEGDENPWMLLSGLDFQIAERTKIVLEYATNTEFIGDDEDFSGIFNVGLRFFGERMSFTLTGFRPLGTDNDGFGLFPLTMFSMHW